MFHSIQTAVPTANPCRIEQDASPGEGFSPRAWGEAVLVGDKTVGDKTKLPYQGGTQ